METAERDLERCFLRMTEPSPCDTRGIGIFLANLKTILLFAESFEVEEGLSREPAVGVGADPRVAEDAGAEEGVTLNWGAAAAAGVDSPGKVGAAGAEDLGARQIRSEAASISGSMSRSALLSSSMIRDSVAGGQVQKENLAGGEGSGAGATTGPLCAWRRWYRRPFAFLYRFLHSTKGHLWGLLALGSSSQCPWIMWYLRPLPFLYVLSQPSKVQGNLRFSRTRSSRQIQGNTVPTPGPF